MAATPQQLAIESAEKAGLHKVSETLKSMESRIEAADPLGIMGFPPLPRDARAAIDATLESARAALDEFHAPFCDALVATLRLRRHARDRHEPPRSLRCPDDDFKECKFSVTDR